MELNDIVNSNFVFDIFNVENQSFITDIAHTRNKVLMKALHVMSNIVLQSAEVTFMNSPYVELDNIHFNDKARCRRFVRKRVRIPTCVPTSSFAAAGL